MVDLSEFSSSTAWWNVSFFRVAYDWDSKNSSSYILVAFSWRCREDSLGRFQEKEVYCLIILSSPSTSGC